MFIPVNQPLLSKESKKNLRTAMNSGWLSSAGPFVHQFENSFAKFIGVKHAVAVSNGTAALHIALLALNIGPKDEVIVPAFTMAATWLAVLYVGAKPVFVDCDLDTCNIDPKLIEAAITPRTKAIIPVHIYGHPAPMDEVMKIAKKHHLAVIEDAAEAHGALYKGKKCGSIGNIGCFSFYANKIITSGEGGMVVTNNVHLAKEMDKLHDLYHSDTKRFIHEKIGFNYRLTNLQAAVGLGELSHIKEYLNKKAKMAKQYHNGLKDIPGLILPMTKPDVTNVFWMYALRVVPEDFGTNRDNLKKELKLVGIDTRDFFYSPTDQPVLKRFLGKNAKFPNTDLIAQQGLYLPSGLAITVAQINKVCNAIRKINEKYTLSKT